MRSSSALVAGLTLFLTAPLAAAEASAEPALLACGVEPSARQLHDSSRQLADHLGSGYGGTHPAAVALASSMASVAAALDGQLSAVGPAHAALGDAWRAFDGAVRRSPLPRDRALGPVLPGFRQSVLQLDGLLGCEGDAAGSGLVPCLAVPVAHLLAVVSEQIHQYLEPNFGDTLTEQVEASAELARTAKALHHVLHDLEIAVPGVRLSQAALETSFEGSSFTDTDDPEDREVKTRLAAVAAALAELEGFAGVCHQPDADHEGHEGE